MITKETPPDTQEAYQDTPDEQKKDDILWMLFDRDWAKHLLTDDKNLIN